MTKKDYELIAKVIKESFDGFKELEIHKSHWQGLLCSSLAREFQKENERFDAIKFADASGWKD